jgi:ABC-type branched-subunit amino acid transport system ATPase component/branched-subunit amino acid ABC-type transport system permease component
MSEFIRFAVFGLGTGGLYALLGLGIITGFRSSGVINFSHGAVALVAAYIYYNIRSDGGSAAVAVIAGILSSVILGLLIYFLVIRPLTAASALAKGIALLAVLVVLESLITLHYGSTAVISQPFLPQSTIAIFGAVVSISNIITIAISLVLTVGLHFIYRHSRFGIATSALAESEFIFSLTGRSATSVAAVNWMIGGLFAGVAGVILAPVVPPTPSDATEFVIIALAVALCGNFTSFPLALIGALVIGIGQSELGYYSTSGWLAGLPGLSDALPFLVVIVILVVRGKGLPTRDFVVTRLPRIGSGVIARPWLAIWAVVAVVLVTQLSGGWVTALTVGCIASVLLLSIVVLTGYAGQLSLAQVSIAGVGVLIASALAADWSWPMPLAAVAGVIGTIPVALVVGFPSVRTRGVTLAVVTLGLAEALNAMLFTRNDINASGAGLNVGDAKFFGLDISEITHPRSYAVFSVIILAAVAVMVTNLRRSNVGKLLIAVNSNERAAAALGVNVSASKLYAFVVAGCIAGVGGILAAWQQTNILFNLAYDPFESINAVTNSTLAGIGYISGGILGGNSSNPGSLGGQIITEIGLGAWISVVSGALLLVTIVFNPDGVLPNVTQMIRKAAGKVAPRMPAAPPWITGLRSTGTSGGLMGTADAAVKRPGKVSLEIRDLRVVFGSTTVVDGVNCNFGGGEVVGVIGPNGAGKTTFIDAITGYVPADGTVTLNGKRLHKRPAYRRNRAGVSRSFQSLELFEDLSVLDNLSVALRLSSRLEWLTCLVWRRRTRANLEVQAAIAEFGLGDVLNERPGQLPYGMRRLVAICRSLASNPSVLLLDEPAAGLGDADRRELQRLIRRLADEWGMAVVLVEHDVELVMNVSDRVMALEYGKLIAEGTPAEIRQHPEVVRSYLGAEEQAVEPRISVISEKDLNL